MNPPNQAGPPLPPPDTDFSRRLAAACFEFDFFSAVRRLEAYYTAQGFPRIGCAAGRQGDPIHFGQAAFMGFAPRTIHSWNETPPDNCRFQRPALLVYFSGFFGPDGILPQHITTHALERERAGDFTFSNFVNIFQHRLLCFYYRAWAACRIEADLDGIGERRFTRFIGSLCGTQEPMSAVFHPRPRTKKPLDSAASRREAGTAGEEVPAQDAPNDAWPRLFFAGHMISRNRHAEGLTSIISGYFGVRVSIETFRGCWIDLPAGSEWRLTALSASGVLGRTTLLGGRFWDCQGNIRIRIGPVNLAVFRRLLPGSLGAERLRQWVSEYLGRELHWDLQLILDKDVVPETRLGRLDRLDERSQLGYTTFLKSKDRPCVQDVETAIFDLAGEKNNN